MSDFRCDGYGFVSQINNKYRTEKRKTPVYGIQREADLFICRTEYLNTRFSVREQKYIKQSFNYEGKSIDTNKEIQSHLSTKHYLIDNQL